MKCIVVNDTSCLIDLHKGQLLHVLTHLPYQFIVPLPIRESELLEFTPQEWAVLYSGGMETYDLPPERMGDVFALKQQHGSLSANDCFCLVAAQCHKDSIILTGDNRLRKVAKKAGVRVHGVLWVIDKLKSANVCDDALLIGALETWKADPTVFLPKSEINRQLRRLRLSHSTTAKMALARRG